MCFYGNDSIKQMQLSYDCEYSRLVQEFIALLLIIQFLWDIFLTSRTLEVEECDKKGAHTHSKTIIFTISPNSIPGILSDWCLSAESCGWLVKQGKAAIMSDGCSRYGFGKLGTTNPTLSSWECQLSIVQSVYL